MIQARAKQTIPGLTTFAVRHDILVEEGPHAVIAFLEKKLPELLDALSDETATELGAST